MNIDEIKRETMKALGLTDISDVDYITDELIREYDQHAKEINKDPANIDQDVKKELSDKNITTGFGTYGNSLVFRRGYVDYKAGPRGTPNYGCGTDP